MNKINKNKKMKTTNYVKILDNIEEKNYKDKKE